MEQDRNRVCSREEALRLMALQAFVTIVISLQRDYRYIDYCPLVRSMFNIHNLL